MHTGNSGYTDSVTLVNSAANQPDILVPGELGANLHGRERAEEF